jgi:hypothetical protein
MKLLLVTREQSLTWLHSAHPRSTFCEPNIPFLTIAHFAWSGDRPLLSYVTIRFLCYG